MSKPRDVPPQVSGVGWAGLWSDGTLGWHVSQYVYPGRRNGAPLNAEQARLHGPFYRVRISLVPLRDKRGRPIVKGRKRDA